jgi:hypothetical protein
LCIIDGDDDYDDGDDYDDDDDDDDDVIIIFRAYKMDMGLCFLITFKLFSFI